MLLQVLDTTPDVTSTEPNSDATPDDSGPRKITKDIVPTPLKSTMVTVRWGQATHRPSYNFDMLLEKEKT